MTDTLRPCPATDAAGLLPGLLGLRLDEEFLPMVSITDAPAALDKVVPFGQAALEADFVTLRLWPDTLWTTDTAFTAHNTSVDISHGYSQLNLRGVEALHFLANYTYADLMAQVVRQAKAIRTRLNHFDCTIWWTSTRDIHILIERSLAQSFCDHMRNLALRHDPINPSETPRPVAPGAPDRRG